MHLDLNYSRSWFQTPNSYDNLNVHERDRRGRRGLAGLRHCGQRRPALQDRDLQYFSHLHAHHQFRLRLQLRCFRPPGCLQLLPQQQSARRPGRPQPADVFHRPVPHAHQCRNARRLLLLQRHSQPQGGRAIRADLPARERQHRHRRNHVQLALSGCEREPAAGLFSTSDCVPAGYRSNDPSTTYA